MSANFTLRATPSFAAFAPFEAPAAFGGILDGTVPIVQGDGMDEILRAAPGSLGPDDKIDGGGGHDRRDLSATGTLDITAPSMFTGIEELRGTSGTDTFIVSAARLAGITNIVANGGSDILLAWRSASATSSPTSSRAST